MKKIILIILILSFGYSDEYYYQNGKKVYLKEIKKDIKRHHTNTKEPTDIKYYTTKSGVVLGVNNDIIVKCKKNTNCKKELLKYDVEKVEEIAKNYYLLHLHNNIKIFSVSQDLYKKNYIELAHPDFESDYTAY